MEQNEFKVEPTHKSPEIRGNMEKGELVIRGISIPEDAKDFYFPLRSWVLEFLQSDADLHKVTVDLEYFNTSTSSILLDIFKLCLQRSKEKNVEILWIYEEDDLDLQEVGEDYKLMIGDIMTLESKKIDI